MIEDNELRNLFQIESEERLKSLEEQLGILQIDPKDKEAIEAAFRDAHTMKGSARMLNIQSIESIAHQIESRFDAVRKGEISLSPKLIQAIYESLDAIQSFANEAITGQPANVDAAAVVRALTHSGANEKEQRPIPKASPEIKIKDEKEETISLINQPSPVEQKEKLDVKRGEKSQLISTVRVDMQYISSLMNQAADLTVTKNRIARLFERIEELLNKWEAEYRAYQPYSFAFYQEAHLKEKREAALQSLIEFSKEVGESLRHLRNDAYEDIHKLELTVSSLVDQVRRLSLIPLSKLFDFFPKMVRDLAYASEKEIELRIVGGEIAVDKKIIEDMKDPLMHLLRNAISHGIELPHERVEKGKPPRGLIQLIGKQTPTNIVIEVSDDGKGLNTDKIKAVAVQHQLIGEKEANRLTPAEIQEFIFLPGFSTASQISDISGRGVGLDVVKNQVEKLNGTMTIQSVSGQGSLFSIQLPISHLTTQVVLTQVDKRIYALPMEMIEACLLLTSDQIANLEGHPVIALDNQPVSLIFLRHLIGSLNDNENEEDQQSYFCIVIRAHDKRIALVVDVILDEQEVVVIPPNRLLVKVKSMMGTTILKTGEICIILNPFDLIKSTLQEPSFFPAQVQLRKDEKLKNKKVVLLVEDSYTARLLLMRALEEKGYEVIVAENGIQGWDILMKNSVDAVVTDVEMPKMDGFTLTSKIREQPLYYTLPIILLTTLSSPQDRKKGEELGANAFLIKSEPDYQARLLQTLKDLLRL